MPFFSARPTAVFNVRARVRTPYLFRQIITTGYVAAGYQNSSPWRNVNSMNHSTDTTTNRGDLLQDASAYSGGAHNRDNGFIFGANGMSSGTTVSCFNMRNNTTLTRTSGMTFTYSVDSSMSLMQTDENGGYTQAWITGAQGAAVIQKFNLITEVHNSYLNTGFTQGTSGAIMDENFGYWWNDSNAGLKFIYATETQSTPSFAAGFHGQQKGISSKLGKGYGGNEGSYNGGYNLRVTNFATETMTGTVSKPIGNSGEENFDMGQDRQYMLGMYDGAQNNRAWKFTYATNSGVELGASGQPSGGVGGGRSSGYGMWTN